MCVWSCTKYGRYPPWRRPVARARVRGSTARTKAHLPTARTARRVRGPTARRRGGGASARRARGPRRGPNAAAVAVRLVCRACGHPHDARSKRTAGQSAPEPGATSVQSRGSVGIAMRRPHSPKGRDHWRWWWSSPPALHPKRHGKSHAARIDAKRTKEPTPKSRSPDPRSVACVAVDDSPPE